jgi:hypothetical protein
MKSRLGLYVRLVRLALRNLKGNGARLTTKRLAVMSLFLPTFLIVQTVHWIGFLLDDIFFRGYRGVEVKTPLFIVGVPRSGTTFLHRVLAKDAERFTTFKLWELIFAPSVAERVFWITLGKLDRMVGNPVARLIARLERKAFNQIDNIHCVSLNAPEEDYLTLVPIFACFLLVLPFPLSEDLWQLSYFDDQLPESSKNRIMAFYKSCLQRHLYVRGADKCILSKNPSFSPMVKALNDTFPDCQIICNVRNPLYVVPSLLSSMMAGARIFDSDPEDKIFRVRLIDMLKYYYRHLTTTVSLWPQHRQVFVTMEELQADVVTTVKKIYVRFGYSMPKYFEESLQSEYQQARNYRSRHKYSLEQFALTPDTIFEDFSEVFAVFKFRDLNIENAAKCQRSSGKTVALSKVDSPNG